jgi:hypothetical protein
MMQARRVYQDLESNTLQLEEFDNTNNDINITVKPKPSEISSVEKKKHGHHYHHSRSHHRSMQSQEHKYSTTDEAIQTEDNSSIQQQQQQQQRRNSAISPPNLPIGSLPKSTSELWVNAMFRKVQVETDALSIYMPMPGDIVVESISEILFKPYSRPLKLFAYLLWVFQFMTLGALIYSLLPCPSSKASWTVVAGIPLCCGYGMYYTLQMHILIHLLLCPNVCYYVLYIVFVMCYV